MSTDWASILVEGRGNFVIARGKCSGKRLRDLDTSELESFRDSRAKGQHAEYCKEYARAFLALSALQRIDSSGPPPLNNSASC